MIASIHDAAALRDIGPYDMAAYLRSHAWKQIEQIGDRAAVWAADANGSGSYEILLPADAGISEYPRRIAEALHTLEVAEHRSQLEIARDIVATTSDVLRVRLAHGLIENGGLPLKLGVAMVESARDLALAAACAAARPRSLYTARKPPEAIHYLDGLRMAQTEQGSFVLNLQSRVPPRWQQPLFEDTPALWEEPFERRALLTLTEALTAARRAISAAASSGDFQPFQDAVRSGVSANLCDALVGLGMDNTADEVALKISWSPTRPAADKTPTEFRFGRDTFPVLREAARVLRESAPIEEFTLFGSVTGLQREEEADKGQATISAWVDHTLRKVRMELSDSDYRKALKAHEDRELVECVGELTKENRRYVLRNVRNFTLMDYPVEDMPEEADPFADP